MSFENFDEIYRVCCELSEPEEHSLHWVHHLAIDNLGEVGMPGRKKRAARWKSSRPPLPLPIKEVSEELFI